MCLPLPFIWYLVPRGCYWSAIESAFLCRIQPKWTSRSINFTLLNKSEYFFRGRHNRPIPAAKQTWPELTASVIFGSKFRIFRSVERIQSFPGHPYRPGFIYWTRLLPLGWFFVAISTRWGRLLGGQSETFFNWNRLILITRVFLHRSSSYLVWR